MLAFYTSFQIIIKKLIIRTFAKALALKRILYLTIGLKKINYLFIKKLIIILLKTTFINIYTKFAIIYLRNTFTLIINRLVIFI